MKYISFLHCYSQTVVAKGDVHTQLTVEKSPLRVRREKALVDCG
jgi:hypothetical protein